MFGGTLFNCQKRLWKRWGGGAGKEQEWESSLSRPWPAPKASSCILDDRFSKTCHPPKGCIPLFPSLLPRVVARANTALPAAQRLPDHGVWGSAVPLATRAARSGLAAPALRRPASGEVSSPRPEPATEAAAARSTRGRREGEGGDEYGMGRPRCFLRRLWALVPVLAAGSAPAVDGSYRFSLCLSHSLLSLSLHPTLVFQHPFVILRFSSLLLRPPPPLAPKLSPSSPKQSALSFSPLLPPSFPLYSRRVSLWGRPPPPSPAPPGLLMPRPLGRVSARLRILGLGQAGLGLPHNFVCNGIFCTAPSPRALSKNGGSSRWRRPEIPSFPPFCFFQQQCLQGCSPQGYVPQGYSVEGHSREVACRAGRPRRVQRSSKSEFSSEGCREHSKGLYPGGVQPRRIHPMKLQLGGVQPGKRFSLEVHALTWYIPEDFS